MNDSERRDRLVKWINEIYKQVQEVVTNHHIFWEVQDIIISNEKLWKTPSAFFLWMRSVFAHSAATAVRRQVDSDDKSVSLLKLLKELQAYPHVVSRAHFKMFYGPGRAQDLADKDFDQFACKGQPYLNQTMIQKDIDDLIAMTKKIKRYVNKRVAHYDAKKPSRVPTFRDLGESIDFLEKTVRKYHLMLTAIGTTRLLPYFQYDWKKIFRMTWIEEK